MAFTVTWLEISLTARVEVRWLTAALLGWSEECNDQKNLKDKTKSNTHRTKFHCPRRSGDPQQQAPLRQSRRC